MAGQTASYDFENHLVSLASPANGTGLASYTYDADGNRVSTYVSSNNPTTTSYVVDTSLPYASVVEEYTGTATAPSARYDYGDDLVRMDRGSGVYYYLYDGLGSTRQLVNTSGTVTDSYGYLAFGEMASHTGSTVNPFLFNAQQFDGASGDYYLRARYYDQSNGRFLSQDAFRGRDQDPATLHRYEYAADEPIDYVDPTGLYTQANGYSIEAAVDPVYGAEHPGNIVTYGAYQYFDRNGWLRGLGYTRGTSFRKPDIFNVSTFSYLEIKPFSYAGIAAADIAMTLNELAYGLKVPYYTGANPNGAFFADGLWEPPTTLKAGGDLYFLTNIDGVIFYTNIAEEAREIAAAAALALDRAALRALLSRIVIQGGGAALARIPGIVATGRAVDGARFRLELGSGLAFAALGVL